MTRLAALALATLKGHRGVAIAVLLLVMIGLVYSREIWTERTIRPGMLVTSRGIFKIPSAGVKLRVWSEDLILFYEVYDITGKLLIRSERRASTHSKWGLLWDEQNCLWTLSSDIGNTVWRLDSEGTYTETIVMYGDTDWNGKVPRVLRKHDSFIPVAHLRSPRNGK